MADDKPVVLIVDDTPANVELLHGMLRDDYRVKVATSGDKALRLADTEPRPDIILLDIMMPGLSGYEVCHRLKQGAETRALPVIFITSKTQAEDEQHGLSLGAVDFISKPFNQVTVEARVRTHLASYETTSKLIQENRELRVRAERVFREFTEKSLAELISSGEGDHLEFKSTLRWNLRSDKSDKRIENACLKTVAGYLNADGGVLLVGVGDAGELIGIDKDCFRNDDKMLLHWVNLIKGCMGAEFMRCIKAAIQAIDDQRILIVQCLPSVKPVFFKRDNEESFFVRMGNSTQALKPSEILAYIEQRFHSS